MVIFTLIKIENPIIRYSRMVRMLSAVILLLFLTSSGVLAQDTLPKFTATTRGTGKNIISWTNPYPYVSQISIQRSLDSLKSFTTILTVPDPSVKQNGFVDAKAANPYMFYRLFIVLDSGKYIFTNSKRSFWDTGKAAIAKNPIPKAPPPVTDNRRIILSDSISAKDAEKIKEKLQDPVVKKEETKPVPETSKPPEPEPERFFIIKRRDTLTQISEKDFRRFRDSIVLKTKDTIAFKSLDTILIKPFVPKEVYKPSAYVYTEKDGNVMIALSDAARKHYSIKFFEDDNTPLFEIKQVKESSMIIDKENFMHAGWFRFELYDEGKLKENHKLYIPKDF